MQNTQVDTNARLKELMDQEPNLTRPLVGEIVGMSRAAVDMWLRPPDTPNWRPMPDRALRLLEFELGYRQPQYTRIQRGYEAVLPLKINDSLWCIINRGQVSVLSDDNLVQVVDIRDNKALLSNRAFIDLTTMLGFLHETKMEDFGAVKEDQPPELLPYPDKWKHRIEETLTAYPVRCWRSRAEWEAHVETQRAWNKLASRIQTHNVDNMAPFNVADIQAAELALFGNIEQ